MDPAQAFGRNVRGLRERRELTQEQLAGRADLHVTALSNLEAGKRAPRFATILKLSAALGVDPGELFNGVTGD